MLAHVGGLSTKAKVVPPTSLPNYRGANRERCVISCTLRIIFILMETIKDRYQTAVTAWAKSLTLRRGSRWQNRRDREARLAIVEKKPRLERETVMYFCPVRIPGARGQFLRPGTNESASQL